MNKRKPNYQLLIFLTLLFASIAATAMVVLRAWYSGEIRFAFLVWNLFLAWMPLFFAWMAHRYRITAVIYGPLWLLFFPNAPYIITDLLHLRYRNHVPIWYDALLIFTFALTGLILGVVSLYLMHELVAERYGRIPSWLFVIAATGLSGYGVYVGRFLRWNSWDIFTQPGALAYDMLASLANPKTYAVSLSLTALMLFAYVIMYTLPRLGFARQVSKFASNK
ncbi:MAG: DUF1361 domain-containing protein [Chloroflexi bacterium]|nr:DUF1361 domain-containing protein [Chloroflexota bacterium]